MLLVVTNCCVLKAKVVRLSHIPGNFRESTMSAPCFACGAVCGQRNARDRAAVFDESSGKWSGTYAGTSEVQLGCVLNEYIYIYVYMYMYMYCMYVCMF